MKIFWISVRNLTTKNQKTDFRESEEVKAQLIKSLMEPNEKCDHAALGKMSENVTALEDVIRIIRKYEEIIKLQRRNFKKLCNVFLNI